MVSVSMLRLSLDTERRANANYRRVHDTDTPLPSNCPHRQWRLVCLFILLILCSGRCLVFVGGGLD